MKQKDINEAGAARIFNVLHGLVPNVRTLTFISAANKHGKQQPAEDNNKQNQELEDIIKTGHFGYSPSKGVYGGLPENGFVVRNMTRDQALNLGNRFEQDSIIFAKKINKDDYTGMSAELLGSDDHNYGEVLGIRNVYIKRDNHKDYYTEVKGRKFQFPFFDDDYLDANWLNGTIIGKRELMNPEDVDEINRLDEQTIDSSGFKSWQLRYQIKKIFDHYTNY